MSDYYQFRDETGTPIDYYQLVDDNNELCKEIERLKNKVKGINEEMCYQINLKTENANEIIRLNNIINELSEKNRNLLEDNMRLRKEINLHSGKLVINELEVKEVWK